MNDKQKIAYDAFLVGVEWTLKMLIKCGEIYDFTEKDAVLFRKKARAVLQAKEVSR